MWSQKAGVTQYSSEFLLSLVLNGLRKQCWPWSDASVWVPELGLHCLHMTSKGVYILKNVDTAWTVFKEILLLVFRIFLWLDIDDFLSVFCGKGWFIRGDTCCITVLFCSMCQYVSTPPQLSCSICQYVSTPPQLSCNVSVCEHLSTVVMQHMSVCKHPSTVVM